MRQFVEAYANNGKRIRIFIDTDIEYIKETDEYSVEILPMQYTATQVITAIQPIFERSE